MSSLTNISKLFNLTEFQKLQDRLAIATNLAVITVDYKGNPITSHSACSAFCTLVRNNPLSAKDCQKCDSRGGLEAVRLNAPYAYLCHYNLVDIAIPIIVDNRYIGAIMAGQVRLSDLPPEYELEQIFSGSKNHSLVMNISQYATAYEKIPTIPYDTFLKYADLINSISSYIITEALLHFDDKYEHTFDTQLQTTKMAHKEIVLTPNSKTHAAAHEVIQPLLAYIEMHPHLFLSSDEAAKICNVTPSYFSKSFKKVMTVSYIEYITEIKINLAKDRLVQSNDSVEKISEYMGFSSTSYFIHIFKKYENLTPTLYRKYHKKNTE